MYILHKCIFVYWKSMIYSNIKFYGLSRVMYPSTRGRQVGSYPIYPKSTWFIEHVLNFEQAPVLKHASWPSAPHYLGWTLGKKILDLPTKMFLLTSCAWGYLQPAQSFASFCASWIWQVIAFCLISRTHRGIHTTNVWLVMLAKMFNSA